MTGSLLPGITTSSEVQCMESYTSITKVRDFEQGNRP